MCVGGWRLSKNDIYSLRGVFGCIEFWFFWLRVFFLGSERVCGEGFRGEVDRGGGLRI